MHRLAAIVFLATTACAGGQKSKADQAAETCPATDAAIRAACGCRRSEAIFVDLTDKEKWNGPDDAAAMRGFARECATGTNGVEIGNCVQAKTGGDISKGIVIGMFAGGKETADQDADWLTCAASAKP